MSAAAAAGLAEQAGRWVCLWLLAPDVRNPGGHGTSAWFGKGPPSVTAGPMRGRVLDPGPSGFRFARYGRASVWLTWSQVARWEPVNPP